MNNSECDKMYAVRNGSHLLVSIIDEYAIITSEQSGFYNSVNNNDDICIITKDNNFINMHISNQYIHKKVNILNYDLTPDPEPYKHWTLKEINDQPSTIFNTINR